MSEDKRICPCCEHEVDRADMDFTRDCHGITYRLVCAECWQKLMEKGYNIDNLRNGLCDEFLEAYDKECK